MKEVEEYGLANSLSVADPATPPALPTLAPMPARPASLPRVRVLGVEVVDLTMPRAIELLDGFVANPLGHARALYFVNAHTLNLACDQPSFRDLLNSGDAVFGDGTGVRWGARLQGVRLKANLNGTDLIPEFFRSTADRGRRYFLFGATPETIARAADYAQRRFDGWRLAGYRHGYVKPADMPRMVETINDAAPDLLLVGMGNPLQERWIHFHANQLRVPLAAGIGGLFDHWAGNLRRAAPWVRRLGCEWLQLLSQQPHKFARYAVGNPKFLARIAYERFVDRDRYARPAVIAASSDGDARRDPTARLEAGLGR